MNCVGITVSNAEQQLHYSTCTLCEAMCGIEVATKGRQILSIKGDKENLDHYYFSKLMEIVRFLNF